MTNSLSLSFDPFVPMPVLWVALAVAVLLAALVLFLRMRGSVLRAAAALALAAALANPVIVAEEREPLPTTVAVVVDRSQSQKLQERTQTADDALADLQAKFERLGRFDVRVVESGVGETVSAQSQTQLFDSLRSAFRDVPPSRIGGAVFITDGQVHDVPETMDDLGFNAPVHALVTGRSDEYDRQIQLIEAPRFAIVRAPITMTYQVLDRGEMPATGDVAVQIFRNGDLVGVEQAVPGETMSTDIELDRSGKNIIEFAVGPVEGEITTSNNRAVAKVEGIRENLRVLLVSGEPHSGERTWRNLLKSDASVDLVHFTILRPPEKQDGTPINELSLIAFPTRELFVEKIDDFDLIVFDRYQNRNVLPILYYDYIAQYVRNGGALLIAAGPEYASETSVARTPLLGTLPALPTGTVREAAFYPRLTDDGRKHPVTRDLPGSAQEPPAWGRWFRTVDVQDFEGNAIMQASDGQPLLVLNTYDQGRVGLMLSDHGWLWARGFETGGPYVNLYRRLAHWLMKEPDLEAEALTADTVDQTLKIRRQTMADEAGDATIVTPSGETITVQLQKIEDGLFEANVETSEIGLFQIANGELSTLAHVGPVDAPEFRDMISTTDVLSASLRTTGGDTRRLLDTNDRLTVPAVLPVRTAAETTGRDWLGFRVTDESRLVGISRQGLFGGFLGLGLLLLAISAMWYREGR